MLSYGFTTVGATVHIHYCMGSFVEWSLAENKDSKCGKCGMKEVTTKKGCCKDEKKEIKLKIDQQKSSVKVFENTFFSPAFLVPLVCYKTFVANNFAKFNYCNYHPPPNIYNKNLQVLYCTFLI